jgi:hypothetical protein
MQQQLKWIKCQGEVWCPFHTVNLSHEHFNGLEGVFIIWHGGPKAHTVIVGQGNIRECFTTYRTDPRIQNFAPLGIFGTWASAPVENRNGILEFLTGRLTPLLFSDAPLDGHPIEVNLPW